MNKPVSAKSINDKIKNLAKKHEVQDVNKIRIIIAIERLVARLQSRKFLRENLVFSGGFVMLKTSESKRFTRDLDAIIKRVSNEKLNDEVSSALNIDLGDGFHYWGMESEIMDMKSGYNGVRYSFFYKIGEPPKNQNLATRERKIQLDISIDFSLGTAPKNEILESALEIFEPISWSVYPHEYIVADKLHAIVSREGESTRAKDVYDLAVLLPKIESNNKLKKAIKYIFGLLDTALPTSLYEELASYNTDIFRTIWSNKVHSEDNMSFEEAWNLVLVELKKIETK